MADIIGDVSPTRMELLDMKKRIKLAKKGHKLLKEKRDSLVTEFFKIVEDARGSRTEVWESVKQASNDLIKAEALAGIENIESVAETVPERGKIKIATRNVMGVRIPRIGLEEHARSSGKTLRGSAFASSKFHEASDEFDKALLDVLKLAETEETIRRLGSEIKKTKRRVNALEYLMIPRLDATRGYITSRLEEMERESFFRLKMVKRKKQAAAASG